MDEVKRFIWRLLNDPEFKAAVQTDPEGSLATLDPSVRPVLRRLIRITADGEEVDEPAIYWWT